MTIFEANGNRYRVVSAKGETWDFCCEHCSAQFECLNNGVEPLCNDYYPERMYFKKL